MYSNNLLYCMQKNNFIVPWYKWQHKTSSNEIFNEVAFRTFPSPVMAGPACGCREGLVNVRWKEQPRLINCDSALEIFTEVHLAPSYSGLSGSTLLPFLTDKKLGRLKNNKASGGDGIQIVTSFRHKSIAHTLGKRSIFLGTSEMLKSVHFQKWRRLTMITIIWSPCTLKGK